MRPGYEGFLLPVEMTSVVRGHQAARLSGTLAGEIGNNTMFALSAARSNGTQIFADFRRYN